MSIAVELSRLADTAGQYNFAYLLTVGGDSRTHAVAVQPRFDDGRITVAQPGKRSHRNAATQPEVTLLWPPTDIDGYSLIVDGNATVDDEALTLSPSRAVLHRPAPSKNPDNSCGSDCVELPLP